LSLRDKIFIDEKGFFGRNPLGVQQGRNKMGVDKNAEWNYLVQGCESSTGRFEGNGIKQ
jgi:hypothetical protein